MPELKTGDAVTGECLFVDEVPISLAHGSKNNLRFTDQMSPEPNFNGKLLLASRKADYLTHIDAELADGLSTSGFVCNQSQFAVAGMVLRKKLIVPIIPPPKWTMQVIIREQYLLIPAITPDTVAATINVHYERGVGGPGIFEGNASGIFPIGGNPWTVTITNSLVTLTYEPPGPGVPPPYPPNAYTTPLGTTSTRTVTWTQSTIDGLWYVLGIVGGNTFLFGQISSGTVVPSLHGTQTVTLFVGP